MSSFALKMIAMLLMVLDHVVWCFSLGSDVAIWGNVTLYVALRWLTRMSFPLFAFGIVEGYRKTSNRRNYGARLLVFALLSEIPWNLVHTGTLLNTSQSVMFTLFFGYLGICVADRLRSVGESGWRSRETLGLALALLALFAVTYWGRMDYGVRGFAFIMLLYLLDVGVRGAREQGAAGVLGAADGLLVSEGSKCVGGQGMAGGQGAAGGMLATNETKGARGLRRCGASREVVNAVVCSAMLSSPVFVLPAFVLVHFYNGERGCAGRLARRVLYLVYPVHLLLLWLLKFVVLA